MIFPKSIYYFWKFTRGIFYFLLFFAKLASWLFISFLRFKIQRLNMLNLYYFDVHLVAIYTEYLPLERIYSNLTRKSLPKWSYEMNEPNFEVISVPLNKQRQIVYISHHHTAKRIYRDRVSMQVLIFANWFYHR